MKSPSKMTLAEENWLLAQNRQKFRGRNRRIAYERSLIGYHPLSEVQPAWVVEAFKHLTY